jgi:hypothetical protein
MPDQTQPDISTASGRRKLLEICDGITAKPRCLRGDERIVIAALPQALQIIEGLVARLHEYWVNCGGLGWFPSPEPDWITLAQKRHVRSCRVCHVALHFDDPTVEVCLDCAEREARQRAEKGGGE